MAFDTIGKFRLIDQDLYGEEFRCYVPMNENDNAFDMLIILDEIFKKTLDMPKKDKDFKKIMTAKFAVEEYLKKMSNQTITIRLKTDDTKPPIINQYGDLYLIDMHSYNGETGIELSSQNQIL
jgi:hypothetical protein